MTQFLSLAGVLLVGISAITTATVALANTSMRMRDRSALWVVTTALAMVLVAVLAQNLTSSTQLS